VAAHNDRMAAAYLHLAERAQALELPGAATLLARGPPRARAAAAPPSAAAAAAAAAVSEPASSRALSVAPLFHNGDRVRVVSGGHPAAVVVHHLATGLRVPAKLVGDATRLGGGGGGASGGGASGGGDGGSGRAGEAEAVLQGVREVAGAEARLVLANGLHFPAGGGAVDWRLEGQVLIAGGARSLALTQPPTDVPQPPDKHAVRSLAPTLTPSLALILTLTLSPGPGPGQVATLEGDKGSWGVEWGATQPPRYVALGLKQGKANRLRQSALARSIPGGGRPPPLQKPARLLRAAWPHRSAIAAPMTKRGRRRPKIADSAVFYHPGEPLVAQRVEPRRPVRKRAARRRAACRAAPAAARGRASAPAPAQEESPAVMADGRRGRPSVLRAVFSKTKSRKPVKKKVVLFPFYHLRPGVPPYFIHRTLHAGTALLCRYTLYRTPTTLHDRRCFVSQLRLYNPGSVRRKTVAVVGLVCSDQLS
jgi:hypothetical protein